MGNRFIKEIIVDIRVFDFSTHFNQLYEGFSNFRALKNCSEHIALGYYAFPISRMEFYPNHIENGCKNKFKIPDRS